MSGATRDSRTSGVAPTASSSDDAGARRRPQSIAIAASSARSARSTYPIRRPIASAASITSRATLGMSIGRSRNAGPLTETRRDDDAVGLPDRRRDRVQALLELLDRLGVAASDDLVELRSQDVGVDDRPRRHRLERCRTRCSARAGGSMCASRTFPFDVQCSGVRRPTHDTATIDRVPATWSM